MNKNLYQFILVVLVSIILVNCERSNVYKRFYPNGNVELQAEVKDNVYHGKYYEYYESGKLKFECTFVNGLIQGVSKTYYENGNVSVEKNWRDSKLNGYVTSFYENGKLQANTPYINGEMNGKLIEYHDNGRLKKESFVSIVDTLTNITFWYKEYDKDGNLTDMYHIVEITPTKEANSNNYKLYIKLKGAKHEKITVFIGGFDEKYLYTGGKQDTIYSNTLEATYLYRPEKNGRNIIRGIITEYKERKDKAGNRFIDETYAYFTDTLYVKLNMAL